MGRRGPKSTPLKILKARGSWRGKAKEKEPAAKAGCPPMPAFMRSEARKVWKVITRQLGEMGVLTECDGNALARYCQAVAKYIQCEKLIAKKGLTYEQVGTNGAKITKERPESKLAIKLSEECRKTENLFGLNPSARTDLAPKRIPKPTENRGRGRKPKSRFFDDEAS